MKAQTSQPPEGVPDLKSTKPLPSAGKKPKGITRKAFADLIKRAITPTKAK